MKRHHGLNRVFILLISTPLLVGCGLFDSQAEQDLEIRTDKTMHSVSDDSLRVFIKNTRNETVYYNRCQGMELVALQDNSVIETVRFAQRKCLVPTPLQPGETVQKPLSYSTVWYYAKQCTSSGIDSYQLRLDYYAEEDLQDLLPANIRASNAFTLQLSPAPLTFELVSSAGYTPPEYLSLEVLPSSQDYPLRLTVTNPFQDTLMIQNCGISPRFEIEKQSDEKFIPFMKFETCPATGVPFYLPPQDTRAFALRFWQPSTDLPGTYRLNVYMKQRVDGHYQPLPDSLSVTPAFQVNFETQHPWML
ncbi:MAG: hypothetical protein GF372_14595 [Candidatus Marinimicrobia bacterium]|nr:hypothetical protein [Candidatus Neomarinimicrobiota bacterium]